IERDCAGFHLLIGNVQKNLQSLSSPCLNPLVFTRRQSVRICLCEPENKIERVEERRWWPEKIFTGFKGSENNQNDLGGPVMSCPGLARTISRAQQEREVARRGLDQALF